MKSFKSLLALPLCLTLVAGQMVDLTHYNDEKAQTYPINQKIFNLTVTHKGWWENNPKIWLENDEFSMPSHTGTHMDAPSHFKKGGWSIEEIPLNQLISPAVVVDHRDRVKGDSNDVITVSDLEAWESRHGRIPARAMILARSGWSTYYRDNDKYTGMTDAKEKFTFANCELNFPGFSPAAAQWLVSERDISGVATETLSIDPGNDCKEFPAHQAFAKADKVMIENMGTGVAEMPESGAIVLSLPIKNKGASGAPIRMFAYWGDDAAQFQAGNNGLRPEVSLGMFGLVAALMFLIRI